MSDEKAEHLTVVVVGWLVIVAALYTYVSLGLTP